MVPKCNSCAKNVTKKSPGLVCSRCEKSVHATPLCSKLTNKQLTTLRNATGLEWSCEECLANTSRRSSYMMPQVEDSDDDDLPPCLNNLPSDKYQKLILDISNQMHKILKKELEGVKSSLEFLGHQVETIEESIKNQDARIKKLENRSDDTFNKNKYLETQIAAIEQELREMEQRTLCCSLEIAGITANMDNKEIDITQGIAKKLNLDTRSIIQTRWIRSRRTENSGSIMVETASNDIRNRWIEAGKKAQLTLGMLGLNVPSEQAGTKIFIREALSPYMKTLYYNARNSLKSSHKYLWCKNGVIYCRKSDNSKVSIIRSSRDISKLSE
ncbi:unnamed protein product [Euphydryas editha]|uniref:Zinc finger DNA binding protein n=1 Tax=Euphydryas editha TaxID=104508 RepID=A0AAU9TUG1_EUPED|nr:unnamed protein product [Euphydryas editha]